MATVQRMKVLVAHPSADRYGSDRMMVETVAGLREHGHDVIVALPEPGPGVTDVEAAGATVLYASTAVVRKSALRPRGLARFAGELATSAPRLNALLARLRPDVLYVSTVTVPLWSAVAKARGIPVVVHVHEAEQPGSAIVATGLTAPLLLADRVIVNSEFTRSTVTAAVPALADRCTVVHNGVAGPEAFDTRVDPLRTELATSASGAPAPRLVLVGRVSPRKGTDVALEAVRQVRARGVDASIDVLGAVFGGYEWFENQLRTEYADLAAAGALTWRGYEAHPWSALSEADIALVPSVLTESFGNVAVEAALAGRPAIVSDAGALAEVVADNPAASIVPPKDPQALAAAIEEMVREWPQVARLAEAAVPESARRFAPSRYRDQVVTVLEECR